MRQFERLAERRSGVVVRQGVGILAAGIEIEPRPLYRLVAEALERKARESPRAC